MPGDMQAGIGVPPGYLGGRVRAVIIDDEYTVHVVGDAVQGSLEQPLLIVGRDNHRYRFILIRGPYRSSFGFAW